MSTKLIAAAITATDPLASTETVAQAAADALNHPDVIANAVEALRTADRERSGHDWPEHVNVEVFTEIARAVLRSVGGAR